MHVEAIKTSIIESPQAIEAALKQALPKIHEQTIVAITSKIISICEDRVVPRQNQDKKTLIYEEADAVIEGESQVSDFILTLKNNILIPSAGIDESNGKAAYILYPKDVQASAERIWTFLRKKYQLSQVGVLVTDSHTTPLRRGVTGIALAWCGFKPLYSYVGQPDLYHRPLQHTQVNLVDALAAAAVLEMGEGPEQTPIALMRSVSKIEFLDRVPSEEEIKSITIPLEKDLYFPFLNKARWQFKGQIH